MAYPKIISHQFTISAKGETRHLQIRLPRDAHRLIGVETSIRMLQAVSPAPAPASFLQSFEMAFAKQVGTLRLSQPGCSGQFYSCPVKDENASVGYGDFSATDTFSPKDATHGFHRLEDPLNVPRQAALILGLYQDTSFSGYGQNLHYTVSLHIWYETLNPKPC